MYAFLEDGYTQDGYIAEVARLHPAVSFTYRPALYEEREAWRRAGAKAFDAKADTKLAADLIVGHITGWDVKKRDGAAVDLKADNVARLHPAILRKLLEIVLGYEPSDEAKDAKNS